MRIDFNDFPGLKAFKPRVDGEFEFYYDELRKQAMTLQEELCARTKELYKYRDLFNLDMHWWDTATTPQKIEALDEITDSLENKRNDLEGL